MRYETRIKSHTVRTFWVWEGDKLIKKIVANEVVVTSPYKWRKGFGNGSWHIYPTEQKGIP